MSSVLSHLFLWIIAYSAIFAIPYWIWMYGINMLARRTRQTARTQRACSVIGLLFVVTSLVLLEMTFIRSHSGVECVEKAVVMGVRVMMILYGYCATRLVVSQWRCGAQAPRGRTVGGWTMLVGMLAIAEVAGVARYLYCL